MIEVVTFIFISSPFVQVKLSFKMYGHI